MSSNNPSNGSLLKGVFSNNPVLLQCVGLCPVIAASSSFRDALFLSAALVADLIVTCFIASLILKKVPRFLRVVIYMIIGLGLICPAIYFIETKTLIELNLGIRIYLPLIAVNSVTAVHCETFSVKHSVSTAVKDAVAAAIGVAAVMIICGVIREAIAIKPFGVSVAVNTISMPFGCLITLGFLAAILNASLTLANRQKRDEEETPEEIDMGLDFVSAEENPVQEETDETVSVDLGLSDDDDEYSYLLASVDDLIASFDTDKNGGEEK